MAHEIFISYSSADKAIADAACAVMESEQIRCWIAPRDVVPGREYAGEIVEAIENSRLFVLILSNKSNASRQVLREVERAVAKGLPILPFRIEDVRLSKNLEYFLSAPHWLDAITPPIEKHLKHLAGTTRMLLDRDLKPGDNPPDDIPALGAMQTVTSNVELAGGSRNAQSKPFAVDAAIWQKAAVGLLVLVVGLVLWQIAFPSKPTGNHHDQPTSKIGEFEPVEKPINGGSSTSTDGNLTDSGNGTAKESTDGAKVAADDSRGGKVDAATTESGTETTEAIPFKGQQVDGDTVRDFDYAFALQRPNDNWEFMLEEEISKTNPKACLGMANPNHAGVFLIIAEELPGISLFDYLDGQLRAFPMSNRVGGEPKNITVNGLPAMQTTVSGMVDGLMELSYMISVVKKGNWFYQLVGTSPGSSLTKVEGDFQEILNSLVLDLNAVPRFRMPVSANAEQFGIDWLIRNRQFKSLSYELWVQLPQDWRFATPSERESLGTPCEFALSHPQTSMTQIVRLNTIGADSHEAAIAGYLEILQKEIGLDAVGTPEEIRLGRFRGQLYLFQDFQDQFSRNDMAAALLADETGSVQLEMRSIWPTRARKEALLKMKESLAFYSDLPRHDAAQLRSELGRRTPDSLAGADFSLRGGCYQNFSHGFVLQKPKAGLWKLVTGIQAKLEFPDSALLVQSPADGITAAIIPEHLPGVTHDEYHKFLLSMHSSSAEVEELNIGKTNLRHSYFSKSVQGMELGCHLVTAISNDHGVQFFIVGSQRMMERFGERWKSILDRFEFIDRGPVPFSLSETSYRDYRLGYALATHEPGYEVESLTMPYGLGSICSGAAITNERASCLVIAGCGQGFDENQGRKAVLASAGISDFNFREATESLDSLAGLPAKRFDCVGRHNNQPVALTLCTIRQAETFYLMMVMRQQESTPAEDEKKLLQTYFNFFSLLPEGAFGTLDD